MTIITYAMYRAAARVMTAQELAKAKELEQEADAGNTAAAAMLRSMVREIVMQSRKERANVAAAD
jgi:hypothetical protein